MQPYEQPPQYGQPHPQMQAPHMPPQAHNMPPVTHPRSKGLAITSLALGVVAVVIDFTQLRGIGFIVGIVAAILAVIALIAKSLGGKAFAAGGLALGMAAIPLAVILYSLAAAQTHDNQRAVDCMTKAMEDGKSADEIWACN